jgi:hypothetical protein
MNLTLLTLLTALLGLSAAAALPNKRDLGSDILSDVQGAESASASEGAAIAGDVTSEFDKLFG